MDQGKQKGTRDRTSSSEGDTHKETSLLQRRSRIMITVEEKLRRT